MANEPTARTRATITTTAPITPAEIRGLLAKPSDVILLAQPIVDLRKSAVVGYEILSRFTFPDGKPSTPDKVFATANFCGLGAELDALVVERALALAFEKPDDTFLTINVDPHHLEEPLVRDAIDAHGNLAGIIFELTEHTAIADPRALRRTLDTLRRRGAMFAIDDAGAGYAGLKQILDLQPQVLKIDRALVTEMHDNEAKRALVQMLGELAGRLDAWVLAEGIETEPELNALVQLEVPLGQGYFLAKPEPPWARLGDEPIAALARISRHRHAPATPKRPSAPPPQPIAGEAMEPVATCRGADAWPAASAKIAVRVDDGGKPNEMRLATEDGARVRAAHDLMRVKASAPVSVVVNRALTRPERLRWDPLVCIDDDGKLEGVIPMQRLVSMLSRIVQGSEPQSGMRPT